MTKISRFREEISLEKFFLSCVVSTKTPACYNHLEKIMGFPVIGYGESLLAQ